MKQNIFRAFREKSFIFLWVGEVLTQVSINLFTFYLILSVFTLTRSNTAVAGVVLTLTVPAILFGVVAGVYVDRWSKKYVLIWTNLMRAALIVLLAFMHTNLIIIYIISFLVSFLTQFFIPAESPIIPLIVQKNTLYSANALFGLAIYGSVLIAYTLSGTVILLFGEQASLFILAGLLFAGAISVLFVRYGAEEKKEFVNRNLRLDIKEEISAAFALISKTRQISSSIFLLALAQILILLLAAIAPGYASQVLHMNVDQFPLNFVTPAAIGMIVGAIILINRFHTIKKQKIVTTGLFLSGIAMLLLPYGAIISSKEFVHDINAFLPHFLTITSIHLLILLAFLLGLANSFVFVPSNTLLQENTTDDTRGKMYGLLNAIVGVFSLLPLIAVGGLSDLIGVSRVITGIGICLLLIGVYEYMLHRVRL